MFANLSRRVVIAAVAWLLLPSSAHAADSLDACVGYISGPWATVIRTPGTWCMDRNITTEDDHYAIAVMADDVTIDCKGFTLDDGNLYAVNSAVKTTIYSNLTVRNCKFKGFAAGIQTNGGDNLVVEDNLFDGASEPMTIQSNAESGVFRRNVARNASLWIDGNLDIVDNTIVGPGSRSVNFAGEHGSVRGNRISNGGIWVISGAPVIRDNELTGQGTGTGIECRTGALLKGNVITGFAVPTTGCLQAGGNFISP